MRERDLRWLTPEIEAVHAEHRARFAALYDGGRLDQVPAIAGRMYGGSHGLWGTNDINMLAQPDAWLDDVLSDMERHAEEAANRACFEPFVIELDALGTHYIDALFGAPVYFHEGQVWVEELKIGPAGLEKPDLSLSKVFRQSLRLAEKAVKVSGGKLYISWPVLSCPINIGINLFGQRMLEALTDDPEGAKRAIGIITDVIEECMRAFIAVIPSEQRLNSVGEERYAPPGIGFIDGCATQLISPGHYRRFFSGADARLLSTLAHGGMIHLCGSHKQHIPTWREIRSVRSVQLNDRAAEDLERYFAGLREDQVIYVQPCPGMPIERIIAITGGRRLALQAHLDEPIRLGA